jgi:hypothetical protein
MVSINGNGFPLNGYGFPLNRNGFPLHGNFEQNLKSCFQAKNLKIFEFFLNYVFRDQL